VVAANVLDRFFRFVLSSKKRAKLPNLAEYVKRVVNESCTLRKLEYTDQKFPMLKVDVEKKKKEAAEKKKKEAEAKKKAKEADKPKKYTYPKTKVDFNDFKFYIANEKDGEKRVNYLIDKIDLNAFSFF
jgi:sRNA-binding protein